MPHCFAALPWDAGTPRSRRSYGTASMQARRPAHSPTPCHPFLCHPRSTAASTGSPSPGCAPHPPEFVVDPQRELRVGVVLRGCQLVILQRLRLILGDAVAVLRKSRPACPAPRGFLVSPPTLTSRRPFADREAHPFHSRSRCPRLLGRAYITYLRGLLQVRQRFALSPLLLRPRCHLVYLLGGGIVTGTLETSVATVPHARW